MFALFPTLACLTYSNFQNDALSNSDACLWHILGCQISLSKACLSLFAKDKNMLQIAGEKWPI